MTAPGLADLLTGFFDRLDHARTEAMSSTHEGVSSDGLVRVTATAEPRIVAVQIDPSAVGDLLARDLIEASNDALRRATQAAAATLAHAAQGETST